MSQEMDQTPKIGLVAPRKAPVWFEKTLNSTIIQPIQNHLNNHKIIQTDFQQTLAFHRQKRKKKHKKTPLLQAFSGWFFGDLVISPQVTLADVHGFTAEDPLCEALTCTLQSYAAVTLLHASLEGKEGVHFLLKESV